MKYLEITVGESVNQYTGEKWMKCDARVSVGDDENPKDVFDRVVADLNSWMPNPRGVSVQVDYSAIPGHPMCPMTQKEIEQKLILLAELEAAKSTEEVTTIYNEAPTAVKSDQEFFEAVIKAKQRVKSIQ